jgi:hypothetical protein
MTGETSVFEETLIRIMDSRGIESLEELAKMVQEAGYNLIAQELREGPRCGYGVGIQAVLNLDIDEMARLSNAFAKTYLGGRGRGYTQGSTRAIGPRPEHP